MAGVSSEDELSFSVETVVVTGYAPEQVSLVTPLDDPTPAVRMLSPRATGQSVFRARRNGMRTAVVEEELQDQPELVASAVLAGTPPPAPTSAPTQLLSVQLPAPTLAALEFDFFSYAGHSTEDEQNRDAGEREDHKDSSQLLHDSAESVGPLLFFPDELQNNKSGGTTSKKKIPGHLRRPVLATAAASSAVPGTKTTAQQVPGKKKMNKEQPQLAVPAGEAAKILTNATAKAKRAAKKETQAEADRRRAQSVPLRALPPVDGSLSSRGSSKRTASSPSASTRNNVLVVPLAGEQEDALKGSGRAVAGPPGSEGPRPTNSRMSSWVMPTFSATPHPVVSDTSARDHNSTTSQHGAAAPAGPLVHLAATPKELLPAPKLLRGMTLDHLAKRIRPEENDGKKTDSTFEFPPEGWEDEEGNNSMKTKLSKEEEMNPNLNETSEGLQVDHDSNELPLDEEKTKSKNHEGITILEEFEPVPNLFSDVDGQSEATQPPGVSAAGQDVVETGDEVAAANAAKTTPRPNQLKMRRAAAVALFLARMKKAQGAKDKAPLEEALLAKMTARDKEKERQGEIPRDEEAVDGVGEPGEVDRTGEDEDEQPLLSKRGILPFTNFVDLINANFEKRAIELRGQLTTLPLTPVVLMNPSSGEEENEFELSHEEVEQQAEQPILSEREVGKFFRSTAEMQQDGGRGGPLVQQQPKKAVTRKTRKSQMKYLENLASKRNYKSSAAGGAPAVDEESGSARTPRAGVVPPSTTGGPKSKRQTATGPGARKSTTETSNQQNSKAVAKRGGSAATTSGVTVIVEKLKLKNGTATAVNPGSRVVKAKDLYGSEMNKKAGIKEGSAVRASSQPSRYEAGAAAGASSAKKAAGKKRYSQARSKQTTANGAPAANVATMSNRGANTAGDLESSTSIATSGTNATGKKEPVPPASHQHDGRAASPAEARSHHQPHGVGPNVLLHGKKDPAHHEDRAAHTPQHTPRGQEDHVVADEQPPQQPTLPPWQPLIEMPVPAIYPLGGPPKPDSQVVQMLHAPDLPLGAGVVSPQVEVQELKQRMNLARALALKKIPKVQDDSDDRAMNRARAASLPPQPHYRAGDHHNNELQAAGNKDKHHRVTGAAHPRHSGQRRSHQQHHSLTKLQGAGGGRAAGAAGPPRNYSESRTSSPLQDRLAQNGLGVGSPKRSKDDTFLGLLEPDEIPGEDEEKMFHPLMASPKQWGRKYVPRWASTYDTVVAEGANSDELVKYTVSTTTGELLFKHNAKQASATRPRRSVDDIHLSAPQLLHPRSAWFGTRAHGLAPGRVVSNRVGVMFNSTTALTPEQQLQQAKEVDLEQVPAMKNYAVGSDLALGPGEQTLLQQMPPGAMRAKDPARYPFTRGGPVNLAEDGFGMLTRNSRSHSPVQQGARVGQHGQEPHRNKKHPHSNLMHHGGQSGVQQLHSNDDSENNDPARGRRSSFPSGVHQDRFKRWKLNKFAGAQSRLHVVPKHRASTPDRKSVGLLLGEEEDNSEVVPVMQGPRASTGAAAGAGKINFEDGGNKELVPQQAGAVVDLTSLALQVNDQVVAQRNLSRRKSAPGGAKGRTTKGRARSRGGAAGVLAASRRKASKEKNEVALASSSPNSRSGSLDSKKKNYAVTEEQDNVVSYESRTAGGVQIQEPAGAKMLSNSSSKDVGATRYTEMNRQLVDKLLTVLDNELLDADRDSQTGTAAQFRCDDAPRELQARPSPVNYTATANGGNAKRNSKQSTSKRNFHSRAQKLVPALDMQQVPSALEDEDETENLDEMAAGEDEQQPIDQLSKTGGGTNSATILGPQQSPAVGQLRFQAKPLIAPQLFVGIPVDTSQQEPVVLANGSPLRQLPTATSCTTTPAGMILSTSSPLVHPASVVVPALQMQPVSTTTTTMLPGGGTLTTMASGAGISRINGAIAPAPGPTPVTVNSSNMLTRLAPPRIVEYNH